MSVSWKVEESSSSLMVPSVSTMIKELRLTFANIVNKNNATALSNFQSPASVVQLISTLVINAISYNRILTQAVVIYIIMFMTP